MLLLFLTGLLLAGCASVPKDYPRTESTAFETHDSTSIGSYFTETAARHPGKSGFTIAALVDRPYTEEDLQATLKTVRSQIAEGNYPCPLDQDVAELKSELMGIFDDFISAPGRIVWDDPESIRPKGAPSQMADGLVRRKRIEIRGFGSFTLRARPPRVGCNSRTGETIALEPRYVPHFRPGKELRERVNARTPGPIEESS